MGMVCQQFFLYIYIYIYIYIYTCVYGSECVYICILDNEIYKLTYWWANIDLMIQHKKPGVTGNQILTSGNWDTETI